MQPKWSFAKAHGINHISGWNNWILPVSYTHSYYFDHPQCTVILLPTSPIGSMDGAYEDTFSSVGLENIKSANLSRENLISCRKLKPFWEVKGSQPAHFFSLEMLLKNKIKYWEKKVEKKRKKKGQSNWRLIEMNIPLDISGHVETLSLNLWDFYEIW